MLIGYNSISDTDLYGYHRSCYKKYNNPDHLKRLKSKLARNVELRSKDRDPSCSGR